MSKYSKQDIDNIKKDFITSIISVNNTQFNSQIFNSVYKNISELELPCKSMNRLKQMILDLINSFKNVNEINHKIWNDVAESLTNKIDKVSTNKSPYNLNPNVKKIARIWNSIIAIENHIKERY